MAADNNITFNAVKNWEGGGEGQGEHLVYRNELFYRFPAELQDKIEREQFEYTVQMMNSMYAEAGKANCSTFCEGCMACMVKDFHTYYLDRCHPPATFHRVPPL